MSFAHLTLPTTRVQETADFFESTLGYARIRTPANAPMDLAWMDLGKGQQFHIFYVEGFEVSPFEREFGRHIALFHPGSQFEAIKRRLMNAGAELIDPIRQTPFERFFFKEPINGYVFEVIDEEHFIKE